MTRWITCALIAALAGCPNIELDEDETTPSAGGPTVEFDPGARIIPFPNNLLINPATRRVNLPMSCNESPAATAIRAGVINQLDGFGTYQVSMTATFTEAVDLASLMGNVKVYKRAAGTTVIAPADAAEIPVLLIPSMTTRFAADCASSAMINQVVIVPGVPLDQKSTYVVSIVGGATTAGVALAPSFVWALVRQAVNPVTVDAEGNLTAENTPLDPLDAADVATLLGINQLYLAHAAPVAFVDAKGFPRANQLLTWEFTTQTTTDPLDPAVSGSPAAQIPATPLFGLGAGGVPMMGAPPTAISDLAGVTGSPARQAYPFRVCDDGVPAQSIAAEPTAAGCFLKLLLGGGINASLTQTCTTQLGCEGALAFGTSRCAALGCAAIDKVLVAFISSRQYQANGTNPIDATKPVPGAWSDPYAPTFVEDEVIQVLAFKPRLPEPGGANPTGYPTAIFQHGLGQSKSNIFAIAGGLASQGFASVAIDAVAHDSRAVRISNTGACADVSGAPPSPIGGSACYAPFLSPNLGATRDNIRQTSLDQQALVRAVVGCSTAACGVLRTDATRIVYIGQSLGGIIGSVTASVRDEIKASVLNVPGGGWVDILENTDSLAIRCSLVDGLIGAGILTGAPYSNNGTPDPADDTGLCTTQDWKTQPGYRLFSALGRWILDSADPANFARKLAAKRILIQQVNGDTVVPNVATLRLAALSGLAASVAAADRAIAVPPAPSAAVVSMPLGSRYITYATLTAVPDDPATPANDPLPGNSFGHGSLLSPATATVDGLLGTARMQVDALTFLVLNR